MKTVLIVLVSMFFQIYVAEFLQEINRNDALSPQPPVKLFGQYIHKDYKKRYDFDNEDFVSVTEYPPLKEFLEKYSNRNQYKVKKTTTEGPVEKDAQKSKTWDLLHVSGYNAPSNNDKKGWVTLEAVPWSISKVSKWQSNAKPQNANWDDIETDTHHYWTTKPYYHHNNNHGYDSQKPNPRPAHVPSGGLDFEWNDRPYHKDNDRRKDEETIITDGHPPNFPKSPEKVYNRRQSSTDLPTTYPSNGDGEWILLSTTKGYKYPKRQRALNVEPDSVSTTRSVHLTVLPPTGESKVNMTTSHGGLLEVESTFQTVEDSQREYTRKERMKQIKVNPIRNQNQEVESVFSTLKKPIKKVDSSAVMAAVGAGMIPATMAMLVPMAMNGRRRRSLERKDIDDMRFHISDFI